MTETSSDGGPEAAAADGEEGVRIAFEQSSDQGIERLTRSTAALLATGAVGGIDLGVGVLAMLVVREVTGSPLLGGLAFSIGFVALMLARSELFTENFLVPIAAVLGDQGTWRQVVRLWAGTAVTNLLGGWVMMALVVIGVPALADSGILTEVGGHFVDAGVDASTFASAVLAGAVMTLMTWMERGSRQLLGKLVAAVAAGFVLSSTPLLHSIVTSLELFAALIAGAPFGYADWAGIAAWAALGNMVGGLGLVTALRFVQVGGAAIEAKRSAPDKADAES